MKRHLTGVVAFAFIGGNILYNSEQYNLAHPIVYAREVEPEVVLIETHIDWTPERINQEIEKIATEYQVSADVMKKVVACESQYKINARGDGGHSRGLVQIHSTYHPEITDEMADNPAYAIDFLAKHLAQNQGHLWTCWRKYHDT